MIARNESPAGDGEPTRILYCRCAYAKVVPADVKEDVLQSLLESGANFEAVPDLCEMSARKDPRLKDWASSCGAAATDSSEPNSDPPVKIVACYPRAVRWLFHAGGAPLPEKGVDVLNMREESAAKVASALGVPAVAGTPSEGESS